MSIWSRNVRGVALCYWLLGSCRCIGQEKTLDEQVDVFNKANAPFPCNQAFGKLASNSNFTLVKR